MTIIGIIALINLILTISLIFIERKKPEEMLTWIIILWTVPIIGFIAYLIFGGTITIKLSYWKRNKDLCKGYLEVLNKQLKEIKAFNINKGTEKFKELLPMIQFNIKNNESLLLENNEATVITSGEEKYKLLFEDIRNAKESIHIEYYTIHPDRVGEKLIKLLEEKVKEGVEVRIIFDGIANITTKSKFYDKLIKYGGFIRKFRLWGLGTNFRNHRKIVVIDGKIAYTGGMNIGEQYANGHKRKNPWRDTHVRLLGESVGILQYYFIKDWFYLSREGNVQIDVENLKKYFKYKETKEILPIQILTSGVESKESNIKMAYCKMINTAKKRICIQTPYIIPDDIILNALKTAAASGVEVNLMIPLVPPSFLLKAVSDYYIDELIKYNVKVFQYKGYIHAKTLIIDDYLTCIGSVNLDIRSLELNNEICTLFYDDKFTTEYYDIFKEDLKNTIELNYELFNNRSYGRRIVESILRILAPII